MQELRLVLIIVGVLAIASLLLHGLWSNRKEKPAKFGEKPLGKLDEGKRDTQGFDEDGVGSVRVMNSDDKPTERLRTERKEPALHFGEKLAGDPLLDADPLLDTPSNVGAVPVEPMRASEAVVTEEAVAEPMVSVSPTPVQPAEPPTVVPQPAVAPSQPMAPAAEVTKPAADPLAPPETAPATPPAANTTVEPVVAKEQPASAMKSVHIEPTLTIENISLSDADDVMEAVEVKAESLQPAPRVERFAEPQPALILPEPEPEPEPEPLPPSFLVLNIHARHGELLRGNKLFMALEQNHLIFGDNSVYHRHADALGNGPAIFTVTNMVHPGHFPEGGGEHFETPGVAFFLMLPCEAGRADQNFNVMLQTVQRIADALGADVLDHERNLITPHRITEYREKAQRYTQQ